MSSDESDSKASPTNRSKNIIDIIMAVMVRGLWCDVISSSVCLVVPQQCRGWWVGPLLLSLHRLLPDNGSCCWRFKPTPQWMKTSRQVILSSHLSRGATGSYHRSLVWQSRAGFLFESLQFPVDTVDEDEDKRWKNAKSILVAALS